MVGEDASQYHRPQELRLPGSPVQTNSLSVVIDRANVIIKQAHLLVNAFQRRFGAKGRN